ncbi:pseudoazurin [Minwuia thermotolerans]|uniref:Pseudoazurin n=1 Tax=Minwuia thermotolerans TaxID=2056226 RepID=A0A2M9FW83_9PROT|nr:pseudoazurin [Minwuia thermotolerans]PJK27398.1 pseudoazurin [Minwuia thermotolerans]PJK27703.1 pseudoazurin [Minwuia thermotolerans]PJK27985.1 pseudoazurin [Minwuia thermotolerans]PJK30163.1 pseudoazurin [Minwuia thermotolerans]
MKRTLIAAAMLGGLLAAAVQPAAAADFEVKMLNRGADGMMVFEPAYLEVQPGDTVTFLPTDKGHNAETIRSMLPANAEAFKGRMNKPVTVTFTEEGVYGYKCLPHYGMGMVGVVVVGDATANLDAIREAKHPGRADKRMSALLQQMDDRLAAR